MKAINQCLNQQLTVFYNKTTELKQINNTMQQFLPSSLKNYCYLAAIINGRMIINLNEISLATELRYFLPELRDKLRKEANLFQITKIDIRIAEQQKINNTPNNKLNLSKNVYNTIMDASLNSNYKPLQAAWEKMANNIKHPEK